MLPGVGLTTSPVTGLRSVDPDPVLPGPKDDPNDELAPGVVPLEVPVPDPLPLPDDPAPLEDEAPVSLGSCAQTTLANQPLATSMAIQ